MKKFSIGIVGLSFGRYIVQQLRTGDPGKYFQLAAVCDVDETKLAKVAEESQARAVPNLDILLRDPALDVIGLFTGPAGRGDLIRRILLAGKHVLTTKPFELDPEEAQRVLQEARQRGLVVHLNSPPPTLPADLAVILAWQDQYELGRPVGCRADVWASYQENAAESWLDDPKRCPVAPILRLGIYLINDLIRLFGQASKVSVMQSRLRTGRTTSDNAQLSIAFRNNALANIFASFCIDDTQPYANALTVNYERGTIYRNVGPIESDSGKNRISLCLVTRDTDGVRVVQRREIEETGGQYQWEALHRAIQRLPLENETSPETVVEGIRVIQAMAKAERSGSMEEVRHGSPAYETE